MELVTQISGGYELNTRLVSKLKEKLTRNTCVSVAHPVASASRARWSAYELFLDFYESIARSDFHIVCNEVGDSKGYLSEQMADELLYAMLKSKPVIMLHSPLFLEDVDIFAQQIIKRHMSRIVICDLTLLDREDICAFLGNVGERPVNYSLTNNEKAIIQSRGRGYFRQLLHQTTAAVA
jgi:hypothetical protein